MSEAQSETFSPHNAGVLIGLLLFAVFLGEVVFSTQGEDPIDTMGTVEDIAMRLKPVVVLDEMRENMIVSVDTSSMTPDELYAGACKACHDAGIAGAPKIGSAGDWAPRLAKGLDALITSAIGGIGIMAPRGGSSYDDDQMKAVVEYLVNESQ